MERLATLLQESPKLHIRIEGHTDNIGRAEDLQQLSEDRAQAMKTYLVQKGIPASRIETLGHGAKFPINSNDSDESRAKNRRVEIVITKV